MKIQVKNMTNEKGSKVFNQFIIITDEGTYFQSYKSVIAFIPKSGKIQLGGNWDYSRTTGKYRNEFLGEGIAETRRKLEAGIYEINPDLDYRS